MGLRKTIFLLSQAVQVLPVFVLCFASWLFCSLAMVNPLYAAQKPELIRDTSVADGAEPATEIKGPDPLLCEKNIKIGDFYFKRKNYDAAISRYLEAIEYQTTSVRAYESLARAFEKKDEPAKAIAAYQQFIDNNPDSPKIPDFRQKITKLEKKSR
jgi:outer membrane protein assembly factor BamD (BamD/ComL family)